MSIETFYFCSVQEDDKTCPMMKNCKRFMGIKDIPNDERRNHGTAKLYNLCTEENGYKMMLKYREGESNESKVK